MPSLRRSARHTQPINTEAAAASQEEDDLYEERVPKRPRKSKNASDTDKPARRRRQTLKGLVDLPLDILDLVRLSF
jgi:hypothetical protein